MPDMHEGLSDSRVQYLYLLRNLWYLNIYINSPISIQYSSARGCIFHAEQELFFIVPSVSMYIYVCYLACI